MIEGSKPLSEETPAAGADSRQPPAESDTELIDAATQEKYRREYLIQIRRLSCPGCSDDGSVFG